MPQTRRISGALATPERQVSHPVDGGAASTPSRLPRSTIEAASALTPPFTLTHLRERYWQRALRFHPDRGTPRAMQIVNSAYELLRAKLGGR